MVSPDYRNNGVMTKLSSGIIQYAKEPGVEKVIATVHPDNAASQNVVKKTGFKKKGIDKAVLISALANSGTGLTINSTPEQIYNALQSRFPSGRNFITSVNAAYTRLTGQASYASDTGVLFLLMVQLSEP